MPTDFTGVFEVLLAAGVRFVVVGGLAVVLHGIDRLTADVDLVVDLAPAAASEAMAALLATGFRPMAPVDAMEFADPAQRAAWKRDRGMVVFSLWDPTNRRPTVDVFAEPPIAFEALWNDSIEVEIGGLNVRLASTADPKAGKTETAPVGWGSWEDAERLRKWSFLQRTPEQRLAWLTEALEIAYQSGALRPPSVPNE